MIGTRLIEEFVQSVAVSHRIEGYSRVSCMLVAAPESGKTTITTAANATHVRRVAAMSGRSILAEVKTNPGVEFILFNDLTTIRAMSSTASTLLVTLLNQMTQDERGVVGFAGKKEENIEIDRPIGIIGCIPFKTFTDKRSRWREVGFISRMIPFAYSYDREIVTQIKNTIDNGTHARIKIPSGRMPKIRQKPIRISVSDSVSKAVREMSDDRAEKLGEIGIRLLGNYHCLIRAHAFLKSRSAVTQEDLQFLRLVDRHVSVDSCPTLQKHPLQIVEENRAWQNPHERVGKRKRDRTVPHKIPVTNL